MKGNGLFLVCLLVSLSIGVAFSTVTAQQKGLPKEVKQCIKLGDKLYEQFRYKESLEEYLKANELNPDNYEVMWRVTRAYTRIAKNTPKKERKNKEQLYEKAVDFAQRAIDKDPNGVEGHFWLAVAKGELGLFKGGKQKVALSKDVKSEIETVLELDPNYHLAYHVLGRWHYEVANLSPILRVFAKILYGDLPKASNEEAVANFKKAISIESDFIEHHLELGRTYLMMKKYELAAGEFRKCQGLSSVEEDDDAFKVEARELLEKCKKRLHKKKVR